MVRRRGRCRRAMRRRTASCAISPDAVSLTQRAGRSGFSVARTASAQDHQPDRGAAASRSRRGSRSRRSAANSPKSVTPSPRRCRAGRSRSIENEIRSLSRRIDDNRQNGSDGQALAGIERALGEIREVLRSLTPAEQLTGYDEAIRNLGAKLDLILRSNDDPSTVQQLEGAIAALRGIVSNVASNDALARLADDVHTLSAKVDQLARSDGNSDAFAHARAAHGRADLDAGNTGSRRPPSDNSEYLESALRALSERLDRIPVGNDNASAFAHLEQRVSYLLERLEASGDRSAAPAVDLGRVEEGLHDILRSLERQHASLVALADYQPQCRRAPQPMDSGIVDLVKRELSDIRFSQSETDRRTQDSLGDRSQHARPRGRSPVDDRRRSAHGSHRAGGAQPSPPHRSKCARKRRAPMPRPLAGPCAPQQPRKPRIAEIPRAAGSLRSILPPRRANSTPHSQRRRPLAAGAAARDQRNPGAACRRAAHRDRAGIAAGSSARAGHAADRAHVFAVGTDRGFRKRDQRDRCRRRRSRSARRASLPPRAVPRRPPPPRRRPRRRTFEGRAKDKGGDKAKDTTRRRQDPSNISSKIRSLLVGASVVVIVLGTFKMAMTLLDTGSVPQLPMMEHSSEPRRPGAGACRESSARPAMPAAPAAARP